MIRCCARCAVSSRRWGVDLSPLVLLILLQIAVRVVGALLFGVF
jgi:uncharacterized protein YggT (Ycf19 family)